MPPITTSAVPNTVDMADGWSGQVKSDGTKSNQATDVRFSEASTGDRVELKYEPGRTVIK